MKTRAYQLSTMQIDDFTLAGYSVAGEESVILAPELDCAFDIGKCPREALKINHVLLTHGHMDHVAGSLGYALIDVRQKLKEEYLGLTGPQIVELKNRGVQITQRLEMPLVAYLGDTARGRFADLPYVANAKALLIECTFFDPDHVSRARAGKHIHVSDLPAVLEGMNNQHIIITHVTRRTNMTEARQLLRKALPHDVMDRVSFLMSRKFIEEQ